MYQLPVGNLDKIRKARKSVKHVLSEIGLEDCQNFLKEFDQSPEQNSEEADTPKGAEGRSESADAHHGRLQKKDGDDLLGTEWSDFTDGYHGRLRKKWPYRSRTMCCAMCKYSSQNIYHYRNHVARCHECLQTLCALTACHRCIFVAHPRVLKKHLAFFHGNQGMGPMPGEAVHRGNERYQCRKCGFPTHSVFAIKKHIILKHMENYTDQYIGFRYPVSGSAIKLYCCKVCKVNTGTLDQMLHHMLVDPKHFAVNSQVQTMIYENKNFAKPPPNGNGGFVTLPSIVPKPQQSKSFVVPTNGQHGGPMVALNQMQGASNSATLICAPNSNQPFLPPQASALVQLASAEAKGLLQPGATIALRGSSLVQYPNMSLKQAPPPQSQQILIPSGPQVNAAAGPGSTPRSAMVVQNPPANQMTLQGTMLTSQSLLSHLIPTGNRVNGMPTYTFAPLQMPTPGPHSPAGPAANQTKKWITCPLCNELFPSNVFDMHIEVAHHSKSTVSRSESLAGRAAFLRKMPDKTLKCLTCKVLLSEKSVLQHLLHGLGCLYCATTFFSVKQLNEHVQQHNPSGKLYCDFLRQNYKIYTKPNAGILFPYFDVATTAPREVLGECEVNLALVTSSLELIYVQLQPSSQPEICSAPVRVNAAFCPFCDEKFQEESKHLQHLKQKHFVAPTIHAILKTEAFKCVYCNGVYTGKVTQQAIMLHIQRCRSSPKPAKITAPPPPPLPKSVQLPRQPSGLYFLQMPVKQMPAKALGPASPTAAGPSPQASTEQMQSTRRLEAALKEVIAFNKREREHKAAMRKKREQERLMPLPEPEVQSDPNIKLALEPGPLDRRGPDERRNFIARYFNTNPYAGRAETEELCRRLALTKAEVVALFSTKRSRCMKYLKKSSAAVLMGFDMARLAQLKHQLHIPEQRPAEPREEEAESMEESMAAGGEEKMAEEVPMEQNS